MIGPRARSKSRLPACEREATDFGVAQPRNRVYRGQMLRDKSRLRTLGADTGNELAADLGAGVTLDIHASDQLLVYLALASGESRFTARTLTNHAQTTMWLVEQLLPVRFETASCGEGVAIAVRHASQRP
jgi:RNA 3'-terminal phosphate cyclase